MLAGRIGEALANLSIPKDRHDAFADRPGSVRSSRGPEPRGGSDAERTRGFDGDATAYRMLEDGYLDATGVQDVFFESKAAVQAILDLREGKSVPAIVRDEGFVIHAGNKAELAPRMWGARLLQRGGGTR